MKKEPIVLFGSEVLRQQAQSVTVFHKKLQAQIDTIKYTLEKSGNGAALAANQIGILKRIIVINYMNEYFEMVNPEILEMYGEITGMEGCLSLPGFSGLVKRAETVKVKYQDRNGVELIIERSGPMARCLQHEIDHLNGILYIDRMTDEFVENDKTGVKISVSEFLEKD